MASKAGLLGELSSFIVDIGALLLSDSTFESIWLCSYTGLLSGFVGTLVFAAVGSASQDDIGFAFDGFCCKSFSPKKVVVEDPVVNG